MALSESAVSDLLEVLRTGEAVFLIRESVRVVLQELIEAEATQVVGAGPYERSESRVNERKGSRSRTLSTKAGDIDLRIPKLRKGSFFPLILEPIDVSSVEGAKRLPHVPLADRLIYVLSGCSRADAGNVVAVLPVAGPPDRY
jgi:hypothetical protein